MADLHEGRKSLSQAGPQVYSKLTYQLVFSDFRAKLQPNPRGAPAEAYRRVESGRGALGHYIVSDGTPKPYRHKMSVPSVRNLAAMPHLLRGAKLADLPVIYWSLNIWPVEIER